VTIGTQIIVLDEVSSTNDHIRSNSKQLKDGAVVIAGTQSAGRGRSSKQWDSKGAGNLYSSFILKDVSWLSTPIQLPIICAVVLRRAIVQAMGHDLDGLKLKWPNDLYYGDGKLSGILMESGLDGIIVGVGVNILNAPKLSDKKTSSLAQIMGPLKVLSPQELLSIFIKLFNKAVLEYKGSGFGVFAEEWEKYCMHLNKKVAINEGLDDNTPLKEAVFLGLAKDGGARLKVDKEEKERVIYYGELKVGEWNARSL